MVSLSKVKGTDSPADIVTKNVSHQLAKKHVEALGASTSLGRAKVAPVLGRTSQGAKVAEEFPDGT